MQTIFETVQTEFMNLSTLFNGIDIQSDLSKPAVLDRVNDALCDVYVLLNQGFCENVSVCEKCVENRDQLHELIVLVDECERSNKVNEDVYLALDKFSKDIPNILIKMESVYLENINNFKKV